MRSASRIASAVAVLGLLACEGRYRDAAEWLRVTVETRQTRDGEFPWAKQLLSAWRQTEKTLPEAAKEVGRRDPRRLPPEDCRPVD